MEYISVKIRFDGSCLKQEDAARFTPNFVVNLFIIYELDKCSRDLNTDFTAKDRLFGAVNLTNNADPDKYKYSGYGIGFDSRSKFPLPQDSNRKHCLSWHHNWSNSFLFVNATKIYYIPCV